MEVPVSISIKNKSLYGLLNIPAIQPKTPIVLLMCYGFNGDRVEQHRMSVHLGRMSEQQGVTFARFDFRNQGVSDGCFDDFLFSEKHEDIRKIIEFIQCCYYCNPIKVYLVGFSNGCKVAIDACYEYEEVNGIVIWNPILHEITSEAKESSVENKRLYKHPETGQPYKKFSSLRLNMKLLYQINEDKSMSRLRDLKKPVLCVLSEDDDQIAAVRHEIYNIKQKDSLSITTIKGTDHLFSDLYSSKFVMDTTLKWILEQEEKRIPN